MPATPEQLAEARKLAVLSPNIGKHGPRKATLDRVINQVFEGKRTVGFKRKAIGKHDKIVDTHLDQSTNPRATKDRILYLQQTVYREDKAEKEKGGNTFNTQLNVGFGLEEIKEMAKVLGNEIKKSYGADGGTN